MYDLVSDINYWRLQSLSAEIPRRDLIKSNPSFKFNTVQIYSQCSDVGTVQRRGGYPIINFHPFPFSGPCVTFISNQINMHFIRGSKNTSSCPWTLDRLTLRLWKIIGPLVILQPKSNWYLMMTKRWDKTKSGPKRWSHLRSAASLDWPEPSERDGDWRGESQK